MRQDTKASKADPRSPGVRQSFMIAALCGALAACATETAIDSAARVDALPQPAQAPRVTGVETAATREHKTLVASFGGEFRAPAAQQVIESIVARIVAATDLPSERYRVTILNSPVVNAFALPTGNIYVTRGLLALANDTAEVAAVLGHEIAHVTSRHALERAELERRSVLVSRIEGELLNNQAASQFRRDQGRFTVAGFSRQQELEADRLSVRTIAKAGFDPYGSARFLNSLARSLAIRTQMLGKPAGSLGPDITSTHPSAPDRVQQAILSARQISSPGTGESDRARWQNAISGMTFGEDPSDGFVRGRKFIHPRLGFSFTAPEGFALENNPQAVIGYAFNATQLLKLDTIKLPPASPLTKLLENGVIDGVPMSDVQAISINELPAATGLARDKQWTYRVFALRLGLQVYRIIFAATDLTPDIDASFQEAARSFRRLSTEEAQAVKPYRLGIVGTKPDETFESLATRMAVPDNKLQQFLVLNGLEADDKPQSGQRYKLIVE